MDSEWTPSETAKFFLSRGFSHRSDAEFSRYVNGNQQSVELLQENNGKWLAYTFLWKSALQDTPQAAYVAGELAEWGGGDALEVARRITGPVRSIELSAVLTREDLRDATNVLGLGPRVQDAVVSILLARCRVTGRPAARLEDVINALRGRT